MDRCRQTTTPATRHLLGRRTKYAQSRVAGGGRQMAKVAGCDPGCEQLIRDDDDVFIIFQR